MVKRKAPSRRSSNRRDRDWRSILERTSRRADSAPAALVPAAMLVRRRKDGRMTLREAREIAGNLGHPSKMPGFSYGLHAKRCHVGSKMAKVPGSICAGCFALKGYYATWWPALVARDRHHAALDHPQWVDAMVVLINHYCRPDPRWSRALDLAELHGIDLADDYLVRGVPYFRWHDSGDIQSAAHLVRIADVAARTPEVRHWIPTRQFRWVAEARRQLGAFPPNLTIRLSSLMVDAEPPRAGLDAEGKPLELRAPPGVDIDPADLVIPDELADMPTSTVHTFAPPLVGKGSIVCRAIEARENQCGPCRACWDPRVRNVSYPQH